MKGERLGPLGGLGHRQGDLCPDAQAALRPCHFMRDGWQRLFLQTPHSWPPGAWGPPASLRGAHGLQQERTVTLRHGCAIPVACNPPPQLQSEQTWAGPRPPPARPRACPGTQGGDAGGPTALVTLA